MLRAPLSLAKMSYEAASGTVIYRSKMRLGLKRNCAVVDAIFSYYEKRGFEPSPQEREVMLNL